MRRSSRPLPQQIDKPLDEFLSVHMPPSSSRVPPLYRETTKCISYMCVYAYGCAERTERPAQVLMRRCMRYMPERLRVRRRSRSSRWTCWPSSGRPVWSTGRRRRRSSTSTALTVR